ncbi:hypothetical protein FQN50_007081 [Emmonsiellopsis sp. PD_5]|nr:hypothetical protein FQN50_007081 [Emmonsiellopsis sp. PD_5]
MSTDPQTHISTHLLTTKSLPISRPWLSQFLSSQRVSTTPLSALTQTALFRLLASDFTTSLAPTTPSQSLPADISDPAVKERRITGPVPLQLLDIEDIGSSIWSQVESIEQVERGEQTRGREIIRTVNLDEAGEVDGGGNGGMGTNVAGNTNDTSTGSRNARATNSGGPHRLVLQDAKGTRVVAMELKPVDEIGIPKTAIGMKMVVKNATVARGMLLLEPACVSVLGGKIEGLDREWRAARKGRLLARLVEQGAAEET